MALIKFEQKIRAFDALLIAFLTVITRILYLYSPAGRIGDADEAVFGIMAQKIAAGVEYPIYCWGAHYAGAVVSYAAALLFNLFGPSFTMLRLAMLPFSVISITLFYFIYRNMFSRGEALSGALFLVFCPFVVLKHTMAAHGGYGETILGMALIILMSWKVLWKKSREWFHFQVFVLGIICGFFFYILFLVLPAIFSFGLLSIIMIKPKQYKKMFYFMGGWAVGSLPLIIYNIIERGGTFTRSAGRSLSIGREDMGLSVMNLIEKIVIAKMIYLKKWSVAAPNIFSEYISFETFGSVISWSAGSALICMLFYFIFLGLPRCDCRDKNSVYFHQFAVFLMLLILFQWVVNLNRPRHLLPLFLIIPVAFFVVSRRYSAFKKIMIVMLLSICCLNFLCWKAKFEKKNFDPNPMVEAMIKNRLTRFYGSYEATYPIIFCSQGSIIGSPYLLPNNEILSDRRPDYTSKVRKSSSPAFVYISNENRLKDKFKKFLLEKSIKAKSIIIDNAIIYFDLSRPVHAVVHSKWITDFVVGDNY